jgi:hypothetical protein
MSGLIDQKEVVLVLVHGSELPVGGVSTPGALSTIRDHH